MSTYAPYSGFYTGDYYRNPVPYTSSDIGEPVPGWGTTVRVAGPARVGVGATVDMRKVGGLKLQPQPGLISASPWQDTSVPPVDTTPPAGDKPTPWWVWPLGAAAVLGVVAYSMKGR